MKKLIAIMAVTSAACGGPPVDRTGRVPAIAALTADAAAGAQVYSSTCASCHGPAGKGATARAIVSDVAMLSTQELATIAINGYGLMGPVGASLNDQQVANLAAWMKANLKP